MAALYWLDITPKAGPTAGIKTIFSFSAADAKSMKKADIAASRKNAVLKAKARLDKKYGKGKYDYSNLRCVG